jgi:hypothetical protein
MGLETITASLGDFVSRMTSSITTEEAQVMLLTAGGILIYAFTVFHFYKALSRRDLFKSGPQKKNASFWDVLVQLAKYGLLFPLIIFLWLVILVFLLFMVSSGSTSEILLSATAIVVAVRIASYYNEELSTEIAKTVPILLLATFLYAPSKLTLATLLPKALEFYQQLGKTEAFLIFLVVLEWIFRASLAVVNLVSKGRETP